MKYVLVLTTLFTTLFGDILNGVAIRVNDGVITLYDLETAQKEFQKSKSEVKEILIHKLLEDSEIKKYKLEVSNSEFETFINRVLQQRGIPSKELLFRTFPKEKLRREATIPKLYQLLSSQSMENPTEEDLKEFFEKNLERYQASSEFDITIYSSRSPVELQKKIYNPLLNSKFVRVEKQKVQRDKLPPQLSQVLQDLKEREFSPIFQMGTLSVSIFLNEKSGGKDISFETVKDRVRGEYYFEQQQKIVQKHFQKLREEAIIEYIR
jgi:hypothetical protein